MANSAIKSFVGQINNTPQTQRTVGVKEVKNNAGGYVFKVTDRTRLERFLILGTDGGTFYAKEKDITTQNVDFIISLIAKDERLVIDTLVDVAANNRAAKNTPSLFVTALVLAQGTDKAYVRETGLVNKVARTGTHLFELTGYLKALGGLGRAKRRAIAEWYTTKSADQIAYQAVKYRSRSV